MTKVFLMTVAVLIFSVAGIAQNASASSQNSSNFVFDSGTLIQGELQNTLDVKKAKVGDSVILKTTKALKQNGETVVPKGSKLLGRVTEVQQRTKSESTSRLGLIFDRLEGSDLSSQITASLVSIAKVAPASLTSTSDADLFASSSTPRRPSGSSSGGGLLGSGVPAGGLVSSVGNTVGSTLNTGTAVVGNVANTATGTLGSATGAVVRTVDGIQITQSVAGSIHSGATLEAAGRNIRLEKGTAIQLRISNAAPREE